MRTIEAGELLVPIDRFGMLAADHDAIDGAANVCIASCVVDTEELHNLGRGARSFPMRADNGALDWGQSRITVTRVGDDNTFETTITARVNDRTPDRMVYPLAGKYVDKALLPEGLTAEDRDQYTTSDGTLRVFLKPEEYLSEEEIASDKNSVVIPHAGPDSMNSDERRIFRSDDGEIYIDMSSYHLHRLAQQDLPEFDFPAHSKAVFRKRGGVIGVTVYEVGLQGERELDISHRDDVKDPAVRALHATVNRLRQLHRHVLMHALSSDTAEATLSAKALELKRLTSVAEDGSENKTTRYWTMRKLRMSEDDIKEALGDEFVERMKKGPPKPTVPKSGKERKKFLKKRNKRIRKLHEKSAAAVAKQMEAQEEDRKERKKTMKKYYKDNPNKKSRKSKKKRTMDLSLDPQAGYERNNMGLVEFKADSELVSLVDAYELLLDENEEVVTSHFTVMQTQLASTDLNTTRPLLNLDVELRERDDEGSDTLYTLVRHTTQKGKVRYRATLLTATDDGFYRTDATIRCKGSAVRVRVIEKDRQGGPKQNVDKSQVGLHVHLFKSVLSSGQPQQAVAEKIQQYRGLKKDLSDKSLAPAERKQLEQRIGNTIL